MPAARDRSAAKANVKTIKKYDCVMLREPTSCCFYLRKQRCRLRKKSLKMRSSVVTLDHFLCLHGYAILVVTAIGLVRFGLHGILSLALPP